MLKQRSKRKRGIPDLGRLEDVADYLLDPSAAAVASGGFTSGSESEVETDAEVEVLGTNARKVLNKQQMAAMRNSSGGGKFQTLGQLGVEKRAVKLVELGPRMKLRMTKVEEGVCGGKVMWHEFLEKSPEELKEMETVWEARRKQKVERRRLQKENVERKKKERDTRGNGGKEDNNEDDDDDSMDENQWDSEGLEGDGETIVNELEENGVAVG